MSSYADVASHGPAQRASERAAPPVAGLVDTSSTAPSALPREGQSISVVEPEYGSSPIKTETQAAGHAREEETRRREAEEAEAEEDKRRAARAAEKVKREAGSLAARAKRTGVSVGQDVRTYNLIDSVVLVAVGVVGYRRYRAGVLDLKGVGIGVLGLGLVAGVQGWVQAWFRRQ